MAIGEHVKMLQRGAAACNAWRAAHPNVRLELSHTNFSGTDLSTINLSRTNLTRASFIGADLHQADLSHSHLSQTDLSEVDLSRADLRGANLRLANLDGADLSQADLREVHLRLAHLREADLSGANLGQVDLSQTDLIGADLSGADLRLARLRRADLGQANLIGANLSWADLSWADLHSADLLGVTFGEAVLSNLDLSATKNLDACVHCGPSLLDRRTLCRSAPLPLSFLRGCGLSDWEIEAIKLYQRHLNRDQVIDIVYQLVNVRFGDPVQYHTCFISYTSADEAFCQKLYAALQNKGIRTWFAPHDMRGGLTLHDQVERGIQLNDKLLLVLTEDSMKSNWVKTEIKMARKREKEENRTILFPLRLVDMDAIRDWTLFDADAGEDLAAKIREFHIPDDFVNWQDDMEFEIAFQRLLENLRPEDREDR